MHLLYYKFEKLDIDAYREIRQLAVTHNTLFHRFAYVLLIFTVVQIPFLGSAEYLHNSYRECRYKIKQAMLARELWNLLFSGVLRL